jgi:pimeloyl-ACP methyl ester carboxylesterase
MFPNHYQDQATAIRWVRDNISSYGGDPNKLILIGHSAGAQSVTVLGTNHEFIRAVGVPTSSIKGVISVDTEGYTVLDVISNPTGVSQMNISQLADYSTTSVASAIASVQLYVVIINFKLLE